MLLCGANAVVYNNYHDNIFHKYCKQAFKSGVEIFCIFDSLNYIDKLKLGIDSTSSVSGFVEGFLPFTGDILDPNKGKYDLGYYINLEKR